MTIGDWLGLICLAGLVGFFAGGFFVWNLFFKRVETAESDEDYLDDYKPLTDEQAMQHDDEQKRLDQVVTQWSLLRLAHGPAPADSVQARKTLILRYSGAIRSYVGALVKDDADADEVAQDCLVRMLKGDFASADPTKGRFRDFLKVAVKNMVRSHWDKKNRRTGVAYDVAQHEQTGEENAAEGAWAANWQRTVLDATWRSLEAFQRANAGCVYYTLLQLRAANPDDDSPQLAEKLSAATGKPWRADAGRQQLRRARLRFAQLLLEELARSLKDAGPDEIEEELIDLGLIEYVRPFLPDDWREHGELRELS
ncbi:MAG: sigma-70 family RNA polymerase sigma factor [Pirellulaceae bacterium]|nr:sigma-70 family RNA polymerase sigma factor [Pirellulaceae bacterium]